MQLSARQVLVLALPWLLLELATSTPTNITNLILAISPTDLAADKCPTPPTEFLPYPPPPGYQPGPGCPPASSGTQPSENNPPAGFYGGSGSGSGSGSSTQSLSPANSLRGRNPFARMLAGFSSGRKVRAGVGSRFCGGAFEMVEVDGRSEAFVASEVFGMSR